MHVSINSRGGPEKNEVTGWVQIMDIQKQHEGDYVCVAINEVGTAKARARVIVIADSGKDIGYHTSRC